MSQTRYLYIGSPKNLGRHGPVATNDYLYLDETEETTVANNPDFINVANARLAEIEIEVKNFQTGTANAKIRMPCAMTLTSVRALLQQWYAAAGPVVIDINKNGVSILSTKLSIDANERNSDTAATAPVISDRTLAEGDIVTIDIDSKPAAADAGIAEGLRVFLIGASQDARVRLKESNYIFAAGDRP